MPTCPKVLTDTGWDRRFEGSLRRFLPFLSVNETLAGHALRDLGLDSVGAVELLAALEKDYGVRLRDDVLTMDIFTTAGSLWAALTRTAS
jgi:acyl carrier protein